MSSQISNILCVTGGTRQVSLFQAQNSDDVLDLSFNKSVPMPEVIVMAQVWEGHEAPQVGWAKGSWGVASDLSEADVKTLKADLGDDQSVLYYLFSTSGGSPVPWLAQVAEKYPDLFFGLAYYDPEVASLGGVKAVKGELKSPKLPDAMSIFKEFGEPLPEGNYPIHKGLELLLKYMGCPD